MHEFDELARLVVLFRRVHDCDREDSLSCALLSSINGQHSRLIVLFGHIDALVLTEGVLVRVKDESDLSVLVRDLLDEVCQTLGLLSVNAHEGTLGLVKLLDVDRADVAERVLTDQDRAVLLDVIFHVAAGCAVGLNLISLTDDVENLIAKSVCAWLPGHICDLD